MPFTIAEINEAIAQVIPDREAIVTPTRRVTWRDLQLRTRRRRTTLGRLTDNQSKKQPRRRALRERHGLLRSPGRAPFRACYRERVSQRDGNLNRKESIRAVAVVLAAFVNHAQVTARLRSSVRNKTVQLPRLQRGFVPPVIDTYCETLLRARPSGHR